MSKTMKIIIISAIIILLFSLIGIIWFLRSRSILDVGRLSDLQFVKKAITQEASQPKERTVPSDYSKIVSSTTSDKNIPQAVYKIQAPVLPSTLK